MKKMATTASLPISLSPPPPLFSSSILNPRPRYSLNNAHNSSLSITFHPTISSRTTIHPFHNPLLEIPLKPAQIPRISAVSGDALPSEANPNLVENSEQIVSGGADDAGVTIISVLLFIAFVGLSILTIGVIYIAVTDFLQKRERERFEKEEASKKKNKKSGKKGMSRSRAGPKGFGQKIDDDDVVV